MDGHAHACVNEVERKVAVRHRIHAVGGEALKSQLLADDLAHQRQGRARERS